METLENKICLDTDFLVNFLRNNKNEAEFVKENEIGKELATTFINIFELFYGAYKSSNREENIKLVKLLLNRINLLNLSLESSEKAGEISARLEKEGNPLEFRDILVGTTALVNGYSIKTNNVKHFNKIEGLNVI